MRLAILANAIIALMLTANSYADQQSLTVILQNLDLSASMSVQQGSAQCINISRSLNHTLQPDEQYSVTFNSDWGGSCTGAYVPFTVASSSPWRGGLSCYVFMVEPGDADAGPPQIVCTQRDDNIFVVFDGGDPFPVGSGTVGVSAPSGSTVSLWFSYVD